MAVEVVYRSSHDPERLFMDKAEADRHDRMLELASQRGVSEVVVLLGERVAYLKVSQQDWDEAAVKQLIQATY